jgi:hypothetical protein
LDEGFPGTDNLRRAIDNTNNYGKNNDLFDDLMDL